MPAFFAIVMLLCSTGASAATLFPPGHPFPEVVADPREARFGFDWVEGGRVSARAGRSIALVRAGRTDLRLDGMLWAWLRQTPGFNFPLETVDGSFGLALETRRGAFAGRLRYGHASSHRADGDRFYGAPPFVWSREHVTLLGAWTGRRVTLHAGPTFMLRGEPDAPAFQAQAGAEVRLTKAAYAAADLRIKTENAQRVNQSYELGLRRRGARVAVGYEDGVSERGQLWGRHERFFRLGITFGE
jgi:hypothetical protein